MDTLNKLNIFSNRSYTLKNLTQKNIQQNKSNIKMNKTKFVSHKLWIILILIVALSGCSEKKPVEAPIPQISVVQVIQKDVPVNREFVGEIFGNKDG